MTGGFTGAAEGGSGTTGAIEALDGAKVTGGMKGERDSVGINGAIVIGAAGASDSEGVGAPAIVADAAYPANYVLHRSTKARKDYMNSCFGGQCVKKIKLSQSVFGQWIKECAGM